MRKFIVLIKEKLVKRNRKPCSFNSCAYKSRNKELKHRNYDVMYYLDSVGSLRFGITDDYK